MDGDTIARMRALRNDAEKLTSSLADDLLPFRHQKLDGAYRRLPWKKSDPDDINVGGTCSCLMAMVLGGKLPHGISGADSKNKLIKTILQGAWESSGLTPDNAFSTALVLRTFGILVKKHFILKDEALTSNRERLAGFKHSDFQGKSLKDIAYTLFCNAPRSLEIQITDGKTTAKYSPNPAVCYWLIDGIKNLEISFEKKEECAPVIEWACKEFRKNVSLVSAGDDVRMDPVAMAMFACVVSRLKKLYAKFGISEKALNPEERDPISEQFPTSAELIHALELLFDKQEPSGVWPKYFPMFHYPDGGSNYCFTLELLEAILEEFTAEDAGDLELFKNEKIIKGLEKSIKWCNTNRLKFSWEGLEYCGWNSGGQLKTLTEGIPESWATAVVHMFNNQLNESLLISIKRELLKKYDAKVVRAKDKKERDKKWEEYIDAEITVQGQPSTVKKLLDEEIIASFENDKKPVKRRSALLFGPPGTSKTSLVKALAQKLGMPFVDITPSLFLSEGIGNIYQRADSVFRDLMELDDVVILFDEMDALVQNRETEGERIDVISQFLTTSMLPKLADLHSRKRTAFFMATNHRENFDKAILRPGRFDLLICMGPPTWAQKKQNIEQFWVGTPSKEDAERDKKVEVELKKLCDETKELLSNWFNDDSISRQYLDQFTFGDTVAFFDFVLREARKKASGKTVRHLLEALKELDKIEVAAKIEEWAKSYINLRDADWKKYKEDAQESRIQ